MSYLDRVIACVGFDPSRFLPFRIGGVSVGHVAADFAARLRRYDSVFVVDDHHIGLHPRLADVEARGQAVAGVLAALRDEGLIPGWRNEPYPVAETFSAPSLMTIERAAVPLFGVRGYGVHMNGYVRRAEEDHMWIARRSLSKPTGPGKLDQMVAGGQPAGMSLRDNLIKECGEEAGIPSELAASAISVGTVSYVTERSEGLRQDVLFNFDLELPENFKPENVDGEVDAFYLWPMSEVMARLRETDDFKFNSGLVIIDFLVRHGYIVSDHPDYVEIIAGLHA